MNRFLENLQRQAEDNPIVAIGVSAALLTAFSKLLGTTVDMKNAKSWQKEVARRDRNTSK